MPPKPVTRTKTAFELHLGAAATPARVAEAASLLDQLLRASCPDLPEDGVTLEIRNYNTKAFINPQSRKGITASQRLLKFVEDPIATTRKLKDRAYAIGEICLSNEHFLRSHNATLISQSKSYPLLFDEPFFNALKGLSQSTSGPLTLGETEEYTHILRVGKVNESDRDPKARIVLNGKAVDVAFESEIRDKLFELARTESLARVRLECVWVETSTTDVDYDPRKLKILEVSQCHVVSGADVLSIIDAAAQLNGPLLSESLDDVIADSESW